MAKIYKLTAGQDVHKEIVRIAKRERIRTARVEAIGTFGRVSLAFYDHSKRKYEIRQYKEDLEVAAMLGNVTVKDDEPYVHLHVCLGRPDMSVIGGHLVSAEVRPILELVITPTSNVATRQYDEKLNLNVISKVEERRK